MFKRTSFSIWRTKDMPWAIAHKKEFKEFFRFFDIRTSLLSNQSELVISFPDIKHYKDEEELKELFKQLHDIYL